MNVTIIGGGNIGMCLAGEISRKEAYNVTIFVSNPEEFSERIIVEDKENNITYLSGIINATDNLEDSVINADMVICTYPAHLRKELIYRIENYIKPTASIGFFPGYGGAELVCEKLIEKGITIFALQKVPYVARTKVRGKIAGLWSKKRAIKVAAIPGIKTEIVVSQLKEILQIECVSLKNYLAATLLPGNPLLHTSGSYVYLKNYNVNDVFPNQIYYYQLWDDECSKVLFSFSDEMMEICRSIPIDLSEVDSIQQYYESDSPEKLTLKFHSIPSFQMLTLPMRKVDGGYVPDFASRFFKEDIPNGVCILKALSLYNKIAVPTIDVILEWYFRMTGKEYISPDGIFGKDIYEAAIPQLYGIDSINKLVDFYSR